MPPLDVSDLLVLVPSMTFGRMHLRSRTLAVERNLGTYLVPSSSLLGGETEAQRAEVTCPKSDIDFMQMRINIQAS